MAFRVGKFEIAPQTGDAGTTPIGHKYIEKHTGRNKYMKQVRASISKPGASQNDIETLEIEGMSPCLTLNTTQQEIAYNVTEAVINGKSNAAKFRVTTTGKAITLKTNTGYTVLDNVGTFDSGFGEQNEGNIAIKISFSANNTDQSVMLPVLVEYIDGETWKVASTHNIVQSSADAGVVFILDPETLPEFAKEGGSKSVNINSNIGYSIELQGDTETTWITLDKQSGISGTMTLNITASSQVVGASARNLNIVFKSQITGSVIATLAVSQASGDAYSISWENKTISFANAEVNTIKNNNLTSNGPFYLEEVI